MAQPRILVLAGSVRPGSFNGLLADAAVQEIVSRGAAATRIDMANLAIPMYDAGIEAQGIPEAVLALHAQFSSHDGIFIATPEYNSFPSPILLNALDWLSRVRHYEGGMVEAFERPLFAIGAASPSPIGGYRALTALRQKLGLGLGAMVIPAMVTIAAAYQAFDAAGALVSEADRGQLGKVVGQLLARLPTAG
ncbi:MAG: NAD(P)H-dependent oxidoreductase [Sphingomonadales bacterium]|nr:NAD(P)H-dependent oxidoreductase [Sphingomonadales bacterium]